LYFIFLGFHELVLQQTQSALSANQQILIMQQQQPARIEELFPNLLQHHLPAFLQQHLQVLLHQLAPAQQINLQVF
jgi:hypothetical protein